MAPKLVLPCCKALQLQDGLTYLGLHFRPVFLPGRFFLLHHSYACGAGAACRSDARVSCSSCLLSLVLWQHGLLHLYHEKTLSNTAASLLQLWYDIARNQSGSCMADSAVCLLLIPCWALLRLFQQVCCNKLQDLQTVFMRHQASRIQALLSRLFSPLPLPFYKPAIIYCECQLASSQTQIAPCASPRLCQRWKPSRQNQGFDRLLILLCQKCCFPLLQHPRILCQQLFWPTLLQSKLVSSSSIIALLLQNAMVTVKA